MCLIKQKLKTKHYQYLYLRNKLRVRKTELDLCDCNAPDGMHENEYYSEYNKINKFSNWLYKINKKYNYA